MTPAARARTPRGVDAPAGGGDSLLTTVEAAAHVRHSPGTLRNLRYRGGGPAYLAGGRVLYRLTDLEAWLASKRRT